VTAYVISEVEVQDEQLADRYRALARSSIERYGGRYMVRGARPDATEGVWEGTHRLVMVEFPSMQRAREWYASPEYAEALTIRHKALDRRLLFVEAG
jgi:uncharacterized protein (DUF1330 family)